MKISADKIRDAINGFPKMQKDDAFDFSCMRCGKCCKFYKNVMLTPLDIFRAASHLSLAPQDFIVRYCDIRQDLRSKLPYVAFKENGTKSCHFYMDGKCAIHKAKPASCALYPAGRISVPETGELAYFMQPAECGKRQPAAKPETAATLLDWLDMHGIAGDEKFTLGWHGWLHGAMEKMAGIVADGAKYPADVKDTLYSFVCVMMYFRYDTGKDFMPQFEQNCEETDGVIETLLLT